jgi:hypothetical protein
VQSSLLALGSSANPAVAGNNIVLTAKVAGSGNVVPTGSITFLDGSILLGTAPLDASGTATLQTATLAVGPHTLSANYPGDNTYSTASATLAQIVQSATTQLTLNSSANPATYGQPLSLAATVTSNGAVATGTVSFSVDGKSIASASLNTSGVATLTTSSLTPGSHTIIATYAGDGRAGAATSAVLTESILQPTTVALASSANPAPTLTPVILTATVTNSHIGAPTGIVTFTDGATQLGTATLDATGTATLSVPKLDAGSHTLVVAYSGDAADFAATSPAFTQTVNLQPTSTTMTSAGNDPANAQSVLLIAVVHGAGVTMPTGTITFNAGTQVLGSSAVDASGVATLSIYLQQGTNNITATYSGDAVYTASTSLITSITGTAVTQFAMQLAPAALTMVTKQHGISTLTLTSVGGYADTLEFGCLGLPADATCTFSNSTAVLKANGSVNVQVTVDTGDPLGAGALAQRSAQGSNILLCLLPAGLLLGFGYRRKGRRSHVTLMLMLFAAAVTLSATGCAGIQMSSTPAGKYSFKVTASGAATGVTQSQVMTLTVTQ